MQWTLKEEYQEWGGCAGEQHLLLRMCAEGCSLLFPSSLASEQYLRLCTEMLNII